MARWSAHHPWRAIAGWLVFVIVCLGAGIMMGGGQAATSADYRVGEAGRAEAMAAAGGLQERPLEQVLITQRDGSTLDADHAEAVADEVTTRMAGLPEVASIAPPVLSKDGTAIRVDVTMEGPELEGKEHVAPLLAQTTAVQRAHPDLRVVETGRPSISLDVQGQRSDDLARTEMIALPVTFLVLLLVFRSLAMALVPMVLALSSIAAAVGLSMLASHLVPDAGVGTNVILLIGLAVGVDYTLFYLKREREERARSGGRLSAEAAVELAASTSGRAVVVSGVAVAASSAALYLADDVIFSSLATGAIVVTVAAVVSSMTVLPALLAKIGTYADRWALRRRGTKPTRPEIGRFSAAILRPTRSRPALTLVLAVVAMLAMAAPLLGIKLTEVGRDTYSRDLPAMRAYDQLHEAFPELRSTNQVVVHADASQGDEVAAALQTLGARAEADPLFAGAARLRTSADGRVSVLDLGVPHLPSSAEARSSLERLRTVYVPETVAGLPGAEVAVTGEIARYADYPEHQQGKLPLVLGALLLVTFVITVWAFRSVVLGLVGLVLNLLSAAASLGVLTLVFQGSWAEGLLGFTSMGSIGSRVPLFLFVILFGLSMDYQVFVLSRIREAVLGGVPTRVAVIDGIGRSAGVVTSAAVVMVTVFASFIPLHLLEMKQIGFSLAVGVLIDAILIRMLVLPSIMMLLGDRVWWPSRRRAITTGVRLPETVG